MLAQASVAFAPTCPPKNRCSISQNGAISLQKLGIDYWVAQRRLSPTQTTGWADGRGRIGNPKAAARNSYSGIYGSNLDGYCLVGEKRSVASAERPQSDGYAGTACTAPTRSYRSSETRETVSWSTTISVDAKIVICRKRLS